MPEGNMLYVHLKDKALIRNKKRWSQVNIKVLFLSMKNNSVFEPLPEPDWTCVHFQIMYLYYLLGWKGYYVKNPQKITVSSFSHW